MSERAAVIGSGAAGCCAVLELAALGHRPIWIRPWRTESASLWPESIRYDTLQLLDRWLDVDVVLNEGRYPVTAHGCCWGSDHLVWARSDRDQGGRRSSMLINKQHLLHILQQVALRFSDPIEAHLCHAHAVEQHWCLDLGLQGSLCVDLAIDASGVTRALAGTRADVNRHDVMGIMHWRLQRQGVAPSASEPFTLLEACADGWWYAACLGNDELSLTLCREPDHSDQDDAVDQEALRKLLNRTVHLKQLIREAGFRGYRPPVRLRTQVSSLELFAGWGAPPAVAPWLAAGDAALRHDPLSSYGTTQAIWSGLEAAQQAHRYLKSGGSACLDQYAGTLASLRAESLHQRAEIYRSEPRFRLHPFWIKRS